MFNAILLLAFYLVALTNGQTIQEIIFDECGCGSGEFTSTGASLMTGRLTTTRNRCGEIGEDGFAEEPGLSVSLTSTQTLPATTTGATSWGMIFGFDSKPEVPIVTLATLTPANGGQIEFIHGTNRARIRRDGQILVTANLQEDLDSYRIMYGFFANTPVIIATSTSAGNLIFQGAPIGALGQTTVQLNGFSNVIVKDLIIARDWFFGPSINNLLARPVPVRSLPEVRDLKVERGFTAFENRDVVVDLRRLLRFDAITDDLEWRLTQGPSSAAGQALNFNSLQGTFTFRPTTNFVGQVPISVEFGFRGKTCRKTFDVNIFVAGFNGAVTLQEVIFDQCGCQNNEFNSLGPQFIEGRLRMTSNNCGPRGANGFPLEGGLRVPLQPMRVPVETATADWGILFVLKEVPTAPITLATLTPTNGGRPINFEIDSVNVRMTGIFGFPHFLDIFEVGALRVFFGFQRNTPTIVYGDDGTFLPHILDGTIDPLGEMDIVISGSNEVIVKEMVVAVNIQSSTFFIRELFRRPVPQDIPAVNPSALTLPVAQGITSLDIDMSQAIVETDTEDLVWRISEQNEFGEYRNLNSDAGSFTFTPSAQFFQAPRRSFLAEVGLEANQCRNRVQFSFAIAGFNEEESSNVFIFAGVGVGVVVVGVVWALAVVTIRKRKEKKPNDKVVAAKEKLKEEEVRNDEWYQRL